MRSCDPSHTHLALEDGVNGESVETQFHAASRVGPGTAQLHTPPLFRVRNEPIIIVLLTLVTSHDVIPMSGDI